MEIYKKYRLKSNDLEKIKNLYESILIEELKFQKIEDNFFYDANKFYGIQLKLEATDQNSTLIVKRVNNQYFNYFFYALIGGSFFLSFIFALGADESILMDLMLKGFSFIALIGMGVYFSFQIFYPPKFDRFMRIDFEEKLRHELSEPATKEGIQTTQNVSQQSSSNADELIKLKTLLEDGHINQEEFDKLKVQILSKVG